MTVDELEAAFDANEDIHSKFDGVLDDRRLSNRPDLCAFLLLDRLVPRQQPGYRDIVAGAEHDIIYLSVSLEDLAAVATADDVTTLRRCGVFVDTEADSLAMFA